MDIGAGVVEMRPAKHRKLAPAPLTPELQAKFAGDLWLSVPEVATYAGLSPHWLYELAASGEDSPFRRNGRRLLSRRSLVDEWMRRKEAASRGVRLPKEKQQALVSAVDGGGRKEEATGELGGDEDGGSSHGR